MERHINLDRAAAQVGELDALAARVRTSEMLLPSCEIPPERFPGDVAYAMERQQKVAAEWSTSHSRSLTNTAATLRSHLFRVAAADGHTVPAILLSNIGAVAQSQPRPPRGSTPSMDGIDADLNTRFTSVWARQWNGFDEWGFSKPDAGGDCTSYVAWRLNDLGSKLNPPWSMANGNINGAGIHLGDASTWVKNVTNANLHGVWVDDVPAKGAVVCWPSLGHVAIVRSYDPVSNTIEIEESSYGTTYGSGLVVQIRRIPLPAHKDAQFIHMLPGS